MDSDRLQPEDATRLLRDQETLQREANAVLEDLALLSLLQEVGTPYRIGSSVLGLMVWRDIDVHVVSPGLTVARAFALIGVIAAHPKIQRIRFLNERGEFNPTKQDRDERYYFGIYFTTESNATWKIDLSVWLIDSPRSELSDLTTLQAKLTPELRLAILWIKDIWHQLPEFRVDVFSLDIYEAVLHHGVRTPVDFDSYLRAVGKTPRTEAQNEKARPMLNR